MGRRYDTISFLTDYGLDDEFVGVVKAVVRDIAPHVAVLDVTHGIAPFDVRAGSLALARAVSYLPTGVVLAVVDPGVGSDRRAVAVEVAGGEGVLVGPDNGLLAPAVAMAGGAERAVVLDRTELHLESPGSTFDGRDVFAPVAAALCNGADLSEVGTPIEADLLTPGVIPLPQADDSKVICQVLWIDRFGNAELNVGPDELAPGFGAVVEIRLEEPTGTVVRSTRRADSFADIGPGAVGLIVDSAGLLALAMNQRSAAVELGLAPGDQVTLLPGADEVSPAAQPVRVGRRPA